MDLTAVTTAAPARHTPITRNLMFVIGLLFVVGVLIALIALFSIAGRLDAQDLSKPRSTRNAHLRTASPPRKTTSPATPTGRPPTIT